jgi:cell division protein FtsX
VVDGNYNINTSSQLKIDMSTTSVPTPSYATVPDKKTNRSMPTSSKPSPIAKIIKHLNQKSIYKINNPVGRVIALHERLHTSMTSILEVVREHHSASEVNELESCVDKLFDHLVTSLEDATSNNSDPPWEDSHTKE